MKKAKLKINIFGIIVSVLLSLYCLGLLVLFVWAVTTSLKTSDGFMKDPIWIHEIVLDNYINAFSQIKYQVFKNGAWETKYYETMLLNSILYAGGCALFQVVCTATVAYCTAKYKNVLGTVLHYVVIVTLIMPIVGNLPSMLQVMQFLKLHNTIFGAWIMKLGFNNMYYLIFYAAFRSLSWEYAESAILDGANHFTVYFKIMLPLMMTLVGTVALLFFIQYWNDYQIPLLFLPDYRTASVGLFAVFGATEGELSYPPIKIAAGVYIFLPIFIIFIIFRDKIMGNLTEGGIKG